MARIVLSVLVLGILASGCAHTRDPLPVLMSQPTDSGLSCEELYVEYCSNVQVAEEKIKKNHQDDVHDVLLVIFVWPGLADFKNADGIEGNALLDRCIHIRNLAAGKGCDLAPYPAPPDRYK